MTNEYGFFSSKDHDRAYSAEDFCAFFRDFFTDGVLGGNTGELKVSADSGMRVKVSPGTAYIDGRFFRPAETKHIEIQESDGTYPRKDIIVIRCDYSARKVLVDVVEGIASASPQAPQPVRSGMVYELCIAEIYVGADALEITDADITDTRFDTSLCGIVTGVIDTIDTTDLFRQYQNAWELLMAGAALDEPEIIAAFNALATVKKINGIDPDSSGNINITADNITDGETYRKIAIQKGTVSFTESYGNASVIFSKPFKSIPTVFLTLINSHTNQPIVTLLPDTITENGFSVIYQYTSAVNWVAIGLEDDD